MKAVRRQRERKKIIPHWKHPTATTTTTTTTAICLNLLSCHLNAAKATFEKKRKLFSISQIK